MSRIITIAREFGSGGREFARALAEELGFDYYDKEVITSIAEETSLSKEYVQSVIEGKPRRPLPITIANSIGMMSDYHEQQMQSIYAAQFNIIKEIAAKSDCIIVGRCADYILREENPLRIFVYGTIEARLQRCLDHRKPGEDLTPEELRKKIIKMDKDRAAYYRDFTGHKWGEKEYYDLMISTSGRDVRKFAKHVAEMFR